MTRKASEGSVDLSVALDARVLRYTGIGSHLQGLLTEYLRDPSSGRFLLFGDPQELAPFLADARFTCWPLAPQMYSLPGQLRLSLALRQSSARVCHVPHVMAPWFCRQPLVVTIHDLIYRLFPEELPSRSHRLFYATMLRLAARRADRIVAVSAHTQQDVIRLLGVPPAKISVIPNGVGEQFRPVQDPDARRRVCARYGLERPFLLYVGLQKPHKNVAGLVRMFAQVQARTGRRYQLALVGRADPRYTHLRAEMSRQGVEREVVLTGYVPEEDLPTLYSAAAAFAFPSFYEGFGLPPLEAMACGTPVVASNVASLPEVLGDAAWLLDPRAEEAFAEALVRVLEDREVREELRTRGLAQAAQFTWRASAQRTVAIYRELGASRRRK